MKKVIKKRIASKRVIEQRKKPRWTMEEEEELRSLVYAGCSIFLMGGFIFRTDEAIRGKIRRMGL